MISAQLTDGSNDIVLATRKGQAIRFAEDEVRDMGRDTMGVRGITLQGKEDGVLDMVVVKNESNALLAVTENGYGKRSLISDYRVTHRGGKGIKTLNPTPRRGPLVAVKEVGSRRADDRHDRRHHHPAADPGDPDHGTRDSGRQADQPRRGP